MHRIRQTSVQKALNNFNITKYVVRKVYLIRHERNRLSQRLPEKRTNLGVCTCVASKTVTRLSGADHNVVNDKSVSSDAQLPGTSIDSPKVENYESASEANKQS